MSFRTGAPPSLLKPRREPSARTSTIAWKLTLVLLPGTELYGPPVSFYRYFRSCGVRGSGCRARCPHSSLVHSDGDRRPSRGLGGVSYTNWGGFPIQYVS